jgi:hypothetical protein
MLKRENNLLVIAKHEYLRTQFKDDANLTQSVSNTESIGFATENVHFEKNEAFSHSDLVSVP